MVWVSILVYIMQYALSRKLVVHYFSNMALHRAVRYDDIYRMDEIKRLSFHIMFYRLFRGVAKYIVSGNIFS